MTFAARTDIPDVEGFTKRLEGEPGMLDRFAQDYEGLLAAEKAGCALVGLVHKCVDSGFTDLTTDDFTLLVKTALHEAEVPEGYSRRSPDLIGYLASVGEITFDRAQRPVPFPTAAGGADG